MADFHQNGSVTTLHKLSGDGLYRLEEELRTHAQQRPIGLVLPALYSEFETPAMAGIVRELEHVDYLRHIVVVLARASKNEYRKVREFMAGLPCPVTILWVDSPNMQQMLHVLDDAGVPAGIDGKGRSCWLAYGYLLATGDCDVIALHDCDIRNYSRSMLARLCYPAVHPALDFDFVKAFYARASDRLHGRVTRLFMTPLLGALSDIAPTAPLLRFLESFRYPLAGEFAMKASLARTTRIPGDWGLEVGVLSEVYRNCSPHRVCQVDIADHYDHKHQVLSPEDASKGLHRMTCDIAKALFRNLAGEGAIFSEGALRTLEVRYVRLAEDAVSRYAADALLNGLKFDRHSEEHAVSVFARALRQAAACFVEDPLGLPLIPNWNRVIAAVPEYFDLLTQAVLADSELERVQVA